MVREYWIKQYRQLSRNNKSGLALSLFGLGGWFLAIVLTQLFGIIFNQPTEFNVTHFVTVPLGLITLSLILNYFELYKKWHIHPSHLTAVLTGFHGIWALYACLQVDKLYNGYLILFIFSFGLLYLKMSFGFWGTLLFSLLHLLIAAVMVVLLNIEVGPDDIISSIFFVFSGLSSAFVNELNRRKSSHLKKAIEQRKHGYDQLEKIIFPHQIQKILAGQSIEDTLPNQQGFGCCVLFEVVESAKIKHEQAPEHIREIFRIFSLRLRESYDAPQLISTGFRVIELNNKFVFSVGFPFLCPNHQRSCRLALQIAKDFVHIFSENIQTLDYPKPIYGSVMIAAGELEGFFTKGFPIEYNLHGEPLIKVEHMNEICKGLRVSSRVHGSVIMVQDRVFNSLAASERRDFVLIDAEHPSLKVGAAFSHKLYVIQIPESKSMAA